MLNEQTSERMNNSLFDFWNYTTHYSAHSVLFGIFFGFWFLLLFCCILFAPFFSSRNCYFRSLFSDFCLLICFLYAINLLCSFFFSHSQFASICSVQCIFFKSRTFQIRFVSVFVCVCVYKSQRHFIIICIRLTATKSAYPVCWKMAK